MNLASSRRNWPTGRGFERFYGFLGAETNQWFPDLVYDSHPVDPPATPDEGYHLSVDLTDKALEFIKDAKVLAPDKPFFLYYAPGACHAPHHAPKEWIDRFKGQFDMGYEAIREQTLARQKEMGIVPPDTELPPLNPLGTSETRTRARTASRSRHWTSRGPGTRSPPRSSGCSARWPRSTPASSAHIDAEIGRLLDYLEETGQRENTMVDRGLRQRRQRRGRPERLGQRVPGRQRDPRRDQREPGDARRAGRSQDLQPLSQRLGDGVQHAVQDVEALRVQRRHVRPVHHLLARRHRGQGRGPRAVPPRHRPRPDDPRRARRRATRDPRRARPEPLRRRQHALQLRRRDAAQRSRDAVLLDARLAQHLARRLEGRHHPPDAERLEPLRPGHLGALPRRRRPLRAARPGRRGAREAQRADHALVRRGRRQRRVPARRPRARWNSSPRRGRRSRRRATATSTTPASPKCPSRRRSTSATAPSRSPRWSTSRRPGRRACCSRTARASAGTPSTSRTTACTTSTASSAGSSRRSPPTRSCRPASN